jgi:hypothetical protein
MKTLRLLAIWLVCVLASFVAMARMLVAIFVSPARAWLLAIAFDQLANTAFNGYPDETISSRAHRARSASRRWGCVLCRLLDAIDPHHCKQAFEAEQRRKQYPSLFHTEG